MSQLVWNNVFIKIDNLVIKPFINQNIFVKDFFRSGKIIPWVSFKRKFNLTNSYYYKWRQIISAIPSQWKQIIAISEINVRSPEIHLLYLTRMISIENVTSKIVYGMLIHKIEEKSSSEVTIQKKFNNSPIDWPSVYHLAWNITIDSYSRAFQFKCLHNILFLNERLFRLKHVASCLCSFCKTSPETIIHILQIVRLQKCYGDFFNQFFLKLIYRNLPLRVLF